MLNIFDNTKNIKGENYGEIQGNRDKGKCF